MSHVGMRFFWLLVRVKALPMLILRKQLFRSAMLCVH
uniref:Uncharacterized protein n=1 Tax=Rhizophora mucronata TaxID=61149 RepID=A0A2P2PIG6_RHIMU